MCKISMLLNGCLFKTGTEKRNERCGSALRVVHDAETVVERAGISDFVERILSRQVSRETRCICIVRSCVCLTEL